MILLCWMLVAVCCCDTVVWRWSLELWIYWDVEVVSGFETEMRYWDMQVVSGFETEMWYMRYWLWCRWWDMELEVVELCDCLYDCVLFGWVAWCWVWLVLTFLITVSSLAYFKLNSVLRVWVETFTQPILVDACFLSVILTCRDPIFWGADLQVQDRIGLAWLDLGHDWIDQL